MVSYEKNKVILRNINSFKIKEILECGQCFRFDRVTDCHYKIIAYGKKLNILEENNKIILFPSNKNDFEKIWLTYFDLNLNYNEIKKNLKEDKVLKKAIEYAEGIRILRQEPFECLISFIISQNNRIPMIKKVIENISEKYGKKIEGGFAFPTVDELKKATVDELRQCKTGFRDKYILDAVTKIQRGEIDLDELNKLDTMEIKKRLMEIKGVGTKVSDCVILFGYGRKESFPVDVWIKKIMEYLYFDKKATDNKTIEKYARENFGVHSGIAQQYLFNYAFHEKIGK